MTGDYATVSAAVWGWRDGHAGVGEMVPAPPAGHAHPCTRCPVEIEPDEPYYLSGDGAVAWCDGCMAEEEAEL